MNKALAQELGLTRLQLPAPGSEQNLSRRRRRRRSSQTASVEYEAELPYFRLTLGYPTAPEASPEPQESSSLPTSFLFDQNFNFVSTCLKSAKITLNRSFDNNSEQIYCLSPHQINLIHQSLKQGTEISRPKFGLSLKTSQSEHAGTFVFNVEDGGLAAQIGLRMGDTIVEIDGVRVSSVSDFVAITGFGLQSGSKIGLLRDGKFIELQSP